MKPYSGNYTATRCRVLALVLAAGLALSPPSLAAPVALATSPLATSTTSTVKPNIMFVLDDSGSMTWTYLPDTADNFRTDYGYHSSQCNAVYYNPNLTYQTPVDSTGTKYSDATFTAARDNGFDSTSTARNLNSEFIANRFVPEAANTTYRTYGSYLGNSGADALGPYGAFYYAYSGSTTDKNYNSTSSTFYTECNTSIGTATTLFSKRRLATTETATITVSSATPPTATITVSGGSSTTVNSVTVSGTTITSGAATGSTNNTTAATNLAGRITVAGYSATSSGSVVTITGPASAAGASITVSKAGSDTYNATTFTNPSVNSIKAGSAELLSSPYVVGSSSASTTATGIASQITQNGYSATASGNVITITGQTSGTNSAVNQPLTIPTSVPGLTLTGDDMFPDTDPVKLTNFANWYSFYRTRMQMMKTAAGRAFSALDSSYRVGLMKINSSGTPVQELGTFESTQRSNWYSSFYSVAPTGGTPLREALSNAGRYYAGNLPGAATDPVQYSCQQNFTILSTDGYWNGNAGFKLDGSTAVGNQDGLAGRPMYDGATAATQYTFTYTRNSYAKVTAGCSSGKKLQTTPQTGTCTKSVSTGSCTPAAWTSGTPTVSGSCNNTSAPSPSTPVLQGTVAATVPNGGTSDTLADVAMYYYQTDLRTSTLGNCGTAVAPATVGPLCDNNVFISGSDNNVQQHMTTFTLGLGASGRMKYSSSYLNDSSGDYVSVKLGLSPSSAVCVWQASGACNWPAPASDAVENIDDLWHAAVNGHGAYFSATDPTSLSAGLASALAGINARKGAAAASATSTLNPVAGNNLAFVASYTTVKWKGNLEARGINTDTGVVSESATWCVENVVAGTCAAPASIVAETSGDTTIYNCVTPNSVICTDGVMDGTDCKVQMSAACTGTMNAKVADVTDTRAIKTADSTGTALIDFQYANLNSANFDAAHISGLSQWSTLDDSQKLAAAGANLVNYLRGQNGYEDRTANVVANRLYRYREAVLGDALESQPAFIGAPVFSYPYPGYSAYASNQAGRAGTVFMGVNDGMMHAFATDTGQERWAYVPSMVIPNMWKLADRSYASLHANFVNGSPITSDVCTDNCTDSATAVWKTILVAGLNGGGRGYFALDITIPDTPALLWEFTPAKDKDLGYTFGQPIITRKADGTWVVLVTSGYDNGTDSAVPTDPSCTTGCTFVPNSPTGSGIGYLYVLDAKTGTVKSKISTGVGTATAPSGLAKIAAWNDEPGGNKAGFVYGGDLLGNVWRFDINSAAVLKFATLFADGTTANTAGTSPQPITTTPVLGDILKKRIIFIGTGRYLEKADLATSQKQTQYAIKDDDATSTLVNPRTTLVQQFLINNPDGTATRLSSGAATGAAVDIKPVDFSSGRGWYVDFPDGGERVNIDSKLVLGTLLVPTIVPSNTVCAPGGFGWLNFFDYKTGGSITPLPGVPLASDKYDATIVGINVLYIEGSPIVEVVTSTNPTPKKDPDVAFKATQAGFSAKRAIWRELTP